jgi:RNA polymerase sigma-70 factor (ECF subfamily)
MVGDTHVTLLERMREAADPLAWQDFFDRYWGSIFAFARHLGCQEQSADDIIQEVMLAVFQGREVFRYDPARGRFRDWLAAVVRNTVAKRRRRPDGRIRGQGLLQDDGPAAVPAVDTKVDDACQAAFENTLLQAVLQVVRQEVSPETYQAFELSVLHELPGRVIAQATGLSRNAVYKARARVTERLRELGASYSASGQLGERLRRVLAERPSAIVQRSIVGRCERSFDEQQGAGP